MRYRTALAIVILSPVLAIPAGAFSPDQKAPDSEALAALETRIEQAPPREQCYLYAELIHEMTEFSVRQYSAGDVQKGNAILQRVQQLAHKLHLAVGGNDKRLKNAEILLRHTAFRLNEMLHASDYDNRPLLEQTLAQVNQADNEAMMQVFKK
jgi:hypothetical protein